MPIDPIYWMDYVRDKFSHDLIELAALESAYKTAKLHYTAKPTDRTGGSIYYMTRAGLENVRRHIKSHSELVAVGDHLFISNINWR